MTKLTLGFVLQKVVNLGGGTVVSANDEAVVVHVQNQVLTLLHRGRERVSEHAQVYYHGGRRKDLTLWYGGTHNKRTGPDQTFPSLKRAREQS